MHRSGPSNEAWLPVTASRITFTRSCDVIDLQTTGPVRLGGGESCRVIFTSMRKTHKKKLTLGRETVRALPKLVLRQVVGGSDGCGPDNSDGYCPGYSEVNSCVAMCGI